MGKKNRRRPSKETRKDAGNAVAPEAEHYNNVVPAEELETLLMPIIRNAEQKGLGLDDIFCHHHALSVAANLR